MKESEKYFIRAMLCLIGAQTIDNYYVIGLYLLGAGASLLAYFACLFEERK